MEGESSFGQYPYLNAGENGIQFQKVVHNAANRSQMSLFYYAMVHKCAEEVQTDRQTQTSKLMQPDNILCKNTDGDNACNHILLHEMT